MLFLFADKYHSAEKEKRIRYFLSSIPKGESLLDVGAGEMPYRKYCSHLRYVTQDFCKYDGVGDSQGVQTGTFDTSVIDIRSDITAIPLPDASQDNILCTEVLEHVLDPVHAIRELSRLLRPAGKLLITVPGTSLLHFSPYHYFTGFKYHFFDKILPEHGIEVQSIVRVGSIYTVAALYMWFIADKITRIIFPWSPGLFHRLFLILLSPIFAVLFSLNKIPACELASLEAGLLVIGWKKE